MIVVAKLVGAALGSATVALFVLALHTRPEPRVPSLERMQLTSVSFPRIHEACSPSGGVPGLLTGATDCHRTLTLDDGRELDWPLTDPRGDASEIGDYFSANAPISVRHWGGTVYHIAVNDRVFLDYGDTARMELGEQREKVRLGMRVALVAAATMAWHVAAMWGVVTHPGPHRIGVGMVWMCLGGGALFVALTAPRIWWPVLSLTALVAIAALVTSDSVDIQRSRRAGGPGVSAASPAEKRTNRWR
jgi:hypothetical protein